MLCGSVLLLLFELCSKGYVAVVVRFGVTEVALGGR